MRPLWLTAPSLAWLGRRAPGAVPDTLVKTYQAVSSASVDVLWQKVANLADVSWHPLLASTNAPNGLMAKPGMIYRGCTRLLPIPIRIFVERVSPGELMSVRVFTLPGVEERVTYRVESAVWVTRISYSVTLRGWLSPLVWSLMRPRAAQVASALAEAAEQATSQALAPSRPRRPSPDLLGLVVVGVSLGLAAARVRLA